MVSGGGAVVKELWSQVLTEQPGPSDGFAPAANRALHMGVPCPEKMNRKWLNLNEIYFLLRGDRFSGRVRIGEKSSGRGERLWVWRLVWRLGFVPGRGENARLRPNHNLDALDEYCLVVIQGDGADSGLCRT